MKTFCISIVVVTSLQFVKTNLLYTYNVHFIICKLYLHKDDLKKKGTNHWYMKQNK